MKNLSKKIAGLAAAATMVAGTVQGETHTDYDHEETPHTLSIEQINEAFNQLGADKSMFGDATRLQEMFEQELSNAQEIIFDHMTEDDRENGGVVEYALRYAQRVLTVGTVSEMMKDKVLAEACFLLAAKQTLDEFVQKTSDEDLDEKYAQDLKILRAVVQGETAYRPIPGGMWQSVGDEVQAVVDIKNQMALDFTLEQIKLDKNKPNRQLFDTYRKLYGAIKQDTLDAPILKAYQTKFKNANKEIQNIDDRYLNGIDVTQQEVNCLLGELPVDKKIQEVVKAHYVKHGMDKVNAYLSRHYQERGIKPLKQQTPTITPKEAAQLLQNPPADMIGYTTPSKSVREMSNPYYRGHSY